MSNCYTPAQLHVTVTNTFCDDPLAPEVLVILAAVAALPEDHYGHYDTEGTYPPSYLHGYEVQVVASWDGMLPNSQGYGDVGIFSTAAGPALRINVAGGCGTLWFVPVGLEGLIA